MSTINAEKLYSPTANKSVTVPQIIAKVNESAPVVSAITSPSGQTISFDQLFTKVNEGSIPTQVKLVNFTAVVGESYRITAAGVTATLPLGSSTTKGAPIKVAKLNALTAVIKCSGADMITVGTQTGESVLLDAPLEVVVVWNGTGWEI